MTYRISEVFQFAMVRGQWVVAPNRPDVEIVREWREENYR